MIFKPSLSLTSSNGSLSGIIAPIPHWSNFIFFVAVILSVDYYLLRDIYLVLAGILGSYLLVIALDILFVKLTRIYFPVRRILYLNFMSFWFSSMFFWIIFIVRLFPDTETLLMISISSATLLRVLIFYTYYSDRPSKFFMPALNYTYAAIFSLSIIYRDVMVIISNVSVSGNSLMIKIIQKNIDENQNDMKLR